MELTAEERAFLLAAFDLARNGQTELLAAYVDAGLAVNLTDSNGDTLLILAAQHGHTDTVQALLARGADASRANARGQTALTSGTAACARLLREA